MRQTQLSIVARWVEAGGAPAAPARRRWLRLMPCLVAALFCVSCAAVDSPRRGAAERQVQAQAKVQRRAVEQVHAAFASNDPFLRANAIEAATFAPDLAAVLVAAGLRDEAPVVRFTALVVLGKLELKDQAPGARVLLADGNESVRAAAIFALDQCGREVDLSPLAGLLASADPGTRANVAMLLGMAGDPSAIALLKDSAKTPLTESDAQRAALVRLQIAEAVVKLGDSESLDALEAAAFSQFIEVRIMAVSTLGRLGDRQMRTAFRGLLATPPIELQVAAAEALTLMGEPDGLAVVLSAAGSSAATVRARAAIALGRFPQRQAGDKLARLLADGAALVRISAAAAILRRGRSDVEERGQEADDRSTADS